MLAIWDTFLGALESPASAALYALLVLLELSAVSLLLQRSAGTGGVPAALNRGLLGLMALRIAKLPVLVLAWRGNEVALELMPPLLRGGHLLTIILLIWLWLGRDSERGSILLGLGLAAGLGISAGMTLVWLRQPDEVFFNFSNLDYIWGGLCLLLLAAAGLTVLFRRRASWLLIGLHFAILFAGQALNIILALPGADLPVAAMLPMLVAVPMLLYLPIETSTDTQESKVARSDLEAEAGYISSFDDDDYVDESPADVEDGLVWEYDAFDEDFTELERSFAASGSPPPVFEQEATEATQWPDCEEQAESLGREFGADASALIQVDLESLIGEIICGYNLREDQVILPGFLDLSEMPRIASAFQSQRALRLASRARHQDIAALVAALDLDYGDHLLAARLPEINETREVYALLLRADRAWTLEEEENLERGSAQSEDDQAAWDEFDRALEAAERDEPIAALPDIEPPIESAPEPEPETVALSPTVLAQLEEAEAEKEQYRRDIQRLLTYVDKLENQPPASDPATLERQNQLIEELQRENQELRSAASSWDEGAGPVSVPSTLQAQEAKEELRLALQQVAALQVQLDEAMSARVAPQAKAADNGSDKIPADKAEVIASIAQELRQPLSSVLGYTDLLLSESVGILGALQRNFLERVRSSTTRMNNLIDNLIQVAELDSAGYTLDPKPVDMSTVIDDAIGLIRPHLQEKETVLRVDMPPVLPQLHTDRDAIQQILFHLLQNADAATPAEGEITLRAFTQVQAELGEFIMLQVSDSGGGIPEDELPRVFSRIYRAKNPIIQGVGDSGVGLTIAEILTQALGGRIWVESEAGVGATFSVLLPLRVPVAG
jgi:signal transduction histidine kinase